MIKDRPTSPTRCLLCTDLDRTLIPNGEALEHPQARAAFRLFCNAPKVSLAYVSGRHLELVKSAITEYYLPMPNFAITDVGTQIYQATADGDWQVLTDWETHIALDWKNRSHAEVLAVLAPLFSTHLALRLQEADKQNTHKISFYLPIDFNPAPVINHAEALLTQAGIQASLIWSLDEEASLGLLDILPKNATKLHAIEFLQQLQGFAHSEVVFAGDSGNDLPVLVSSIASVLVGNASAQLKQQAQLIAERNGHATALYVAHNREPSKTNGHYGAGILQGVAHYLPSFEPVKRALECLQESATLPRSVAIFGEVLFDCFDKGQRVLGGAPFNIAWHLQAFGDSPRFFSAVGQDALGERILQACQAWGLGVHDIQVLSNQQTGQVNVTFNDNEPAYDIRHPVAYDKIESTQSLAPHTLLYHGSLALRDSTSRHTFEHLAQSPGVQLFCDVNLRSPWWQSVEVLAWVKQATWVKLNLDELRQLGFGDASLETAMQQFLTQFGLTQLIVTQGSKGAVVLDQTGQFFRHVPTPVEQFVDTVGAGDAFTAVYIHGLLAQWSIAHTLKVAQAFASQVLSLQGATTQDVAFYQAFQKQNF